MGDLFLCFSVQPGPLTTVATRLLPDCQALLFSINPPYYPDHGLLLKSRTSGWVLLQAEQSFCTGFICFGNGDVSVETGSLFFGPLLKLVHVTGTFTHNFA